MQRDRLKRLNHLHTIVGIGLGWLLFVVCFSGSVAMIYEEIEGWENPSVRASLPDQSLPINPLIDDFIASQGGDVDNLFLMLPDDARPYYTISGSVEADRVTERITGRYHAVSGEEVIASENGPALWLLRFHQNLQIERRLGRSLVGIAGVFMLLSLLTGVIIHRKIIRDLYKIRWHRSFHLKWKDLHTGLGVWTLPFSITIAFTGAILGLVVLFLPILALAAFKGDQERAIEAVVGPPPEPAGIIATMTPLEDVLIRIDAETPYHPERVSLEHYGDANARYKVFARTEKELVRFVQVDASAVTGEYDEPSVLFGALPDSTIGRIYAAITPLHYGTYGGTLLKVVYYFAGMLVSISIAVGTLIYLERRVNGPLGHRSATFYAAIGRLNAGITVGVALASVAILYSDRLWSMHGADRGYATALVFLSSWGLAIALALPFRDTRRTTRQLMAATATLCLGLPLLDIATAPGAIQTHAAITVNAVVAISGALMVGYLAVSRRRRSTTEAEQIRIAPAPQAATSRSS